MDISLNTGTPTADATGLTEGAAYSVYHNAGITASVVVNGGHLIIYESRSAGGFYLPKLPGTVIRLALFGTTPAAGVSVV